MIWRAVSLHAPFMGYLLTLSISRHSHCQIQANHLQTTQRDAARGLNRYRNSWNEPGSIYRNPSKSALGVRGVLGTF